MPGLAGSPAHRIAYQEAERLWRDVGRIRPTRNSIQVASSRLLFTEGFWSRRKPWATVAACILLAVGAVWVESDLQWISSAMADYRTGVGERRVVTLEDGTSLHLNTDTAVNVTFSEEGRDLHLLKGEASFTVARDSVRPFVVKTGTILIHSFYTTLFRSKPVVAITRTCGTATTGLDRKSVV